MVVEISSSPVDGRCIVVTTLRGGVSFTVTFRIGGTGPGNSPLGNGHPEAASRKLNRISSITLGEGVHGHLRSTKRSIFMRSSSHSSSNTGSLSSEFGACLGALPGSRRGRGGMIFNGIYRH